MKRLFIILAALTALSLSAEHLIILHTNDTHSQIDPLPKDDMGGVARRKVVIDSIRQAEKNVILIDAGDAVQGTLYFNLFKGEVEEMVMNELGYDLRILGNHEFDNGMEALAQNLARANAQYISTNYNVDSSLVAQYFKKYVVKDIDGHRIGFMGLNLEPKGMISEGNYDGVEYVDLIPAANATARFLKDVEGVEKVIAITHIGYSSVQPPTDPHLIASSTDIDVVIGGHSHEFVLPDKYDINDKVYPNLLTNANGEQVTVAQLGKAGRYVGKIDIDLDDPQAQPVVEIIPIDSRLDSRLDQDFLAKIEPYRAGIDSLMMVPVAKSAKELNNKELPILNFLSDFIKEAGNDIVDNVEIGIMNKGGIRTSLPKGEITEGMIMTMLPFANRPTVVDIKGKDLWDVFQVMANNGGDGVSENVHATYDGKTHKLLSVSVDGKPLDMDRTYRVCTIDYLAKGGDYMEGFTRSEWVGQNTEVVFDVLLDYLRQMNKHGKKINPNGKVRFEAK